MRALPAAGGRPWAKGRGTRSTLPPAAVIAALFDEPRTAGQTLELISGDVRVDDAVANAAS